MKLLSHQVGSEDFNILEPRIMAETGLDSSKLPGHLPRDNASFSWEQT